MAKKRGAARLSKKSARKASSATVKRRKAKGAAGTLAKGTGAKRRSRRPGRVIASIVALVLIIAFISLAVSVFQESLQQQPTGITLTPYVYEYVEASKDYVPKLKLSDPALEIKKGQMADLVIFVGNNREIKKDVMLDIRCEARTTQGCAFIDLKYEHLTELPPKTVEAKLLEITTTDMVKPGVYDFFVEASMDGKTYAKDMFMLEITETSPE